MVTVKQKEAVKNLVKRPLSFKGGECIICGETRFLANAHIIPFRFIDDVLVKEELNETLNYTVRMCMTHHKCYDEFMLKDSEKEKIKYLFIEHCMYLVNFYETLSITGRKDKAKKGELERIQVVLRIRKEKIVDWIKESCKQFGIDLKHG